MFSLSENKTKLISASISIKQCLKKDSFEPAPLGPHTVNFWGRRNFLRTSIQSNSVGGEESASEYSSIRKHQLEHPREPEMEFKEFEQWFKSAKTWFTLSAGLNLETFDTILSGANHN